MANITKKEVVDQIIDFLRSKKNPHGYAQMFLISELK